MTQELRIGNWVTLQDRPVIINADDFPVIEYYNRNVSGIPLTPEWLESFGFEKLWHLSMHQYILRIDSMNSELCFSLPEPEKCYCWMDTNATIVEYGEEEPHSLHFNHIHHVHQLQNLVHALTGEELTIKK